MKKILSKLYEHQKLSFEEAKNTLLEITRGDYNDVQIAAFISVFNMRPITATELGGFRDALFELSIKPDLEGVASIDIVGTGGDGKNTFNISTLSALVVAGAGYKVTKHGSYGVSSVSGSSNVLEAVGYNFTNEESRLKQQLDQANICFLHAPLFHPAMKAVVPARKQLGMKTFFNILGPLVNPLAPKYNLFGVSSLELSRLYHYSLQNSERHYAVVHAIDGYDEVSLTGKVSVQREEKRMLLDAHDFGQPRLNPKDLFGGASVKDAAEIFTNVLKNECTEAQKSVVCANAGLAIQQFKPGAGLVECVEEAKAAIESGKALKGFKKIL